MSELLLSEDESLLHVVDLLETLEQSNDPAVLIRAIGEAFDEINVPLELDLSERLEDIRAKVLAVFRGQTIPRSYEASWEKAQSLLLGRISGNADRLEMLFRTSETVQDRRDIMKRYKYMDLFGTVMDEDPEEIARSSALFERWQTRVEAILRGPMESDEKSLARLRKYAPAKTEE